jgi:hypothetical protein
MITCHTERRIHYLEWFYSILAENLRHGFNYIPLNYSL